MGLLGTIMTELPQEHSRGTNELAGTSKVAD